MNALVCNKCNKANTTNEKNWVRAYAGIPPMNRPVPLDFCPDCSVEVTVDKLIGLIKPAAPPVIPTIKI